MSRPRRLAAKHTLLALAVPLALGAGWRVAPAADGLPHHEQVAPGVHAAGFDVAHGSANCGWVALDRETLLVDLPRGIGVPEFLATVEKATGKSARTLVLTHVQIGDAELVRALIDRGIHRVVASPATLALLRAEGGKLDLPTPGASGKDAPIGDASVAVELLPFDGVAGVGRRGIAGGILLPWCRVKVPALVGDVPRAWNDGCIGHDGSLIAVKWSRWPISVSSKCRAGESRPSDRREKSRESTTREMPDSAGRGYTRVKWG